ncbi:MAG: DUF3373 family protein [Acidobacteria bacterium]|nr:DUF3373 family protein [Acidobacteriota bacterium]
MRQIITNIFILSLCLLTQTAAVAQSGPSAEATPDPNASQADAATMRQEIDALKKALATLEQRLATQEKQPAEVKPQSLTSEIKSDVKELEQRVSLTEREQALDRVRFTGDYRFEAHTIAGKVPQHYDGMVMQNLLIKTMFSMPFLGRPPGSVAEINNTVNSHWADYQQFVGGLTFDKLKQAMGQFPAPMQQQLFGMLMPAAFTPSYKDNNNVLQTNRLRLRFDAKVADNVTFTGRLSMYKVFGDSTGVQVFNGSPASMNIDGTTSGVPNSDQLRVDRAYFSWNNIGGSKLYLSIGRRPSTEGPPLNYRQDELRGGTPSGALIDYQFDGITLGYRLTDTMIWRLCYGMGYESGFGNGNLLKQPQDRLKDVHFVGANLDMYTTEKSLVQATYAHAFNVTDGFNGLMVLNTNPLTGESVPAPMVMRYTPSANLGGIHLFGVNLTHKVKSFDVYVSPNLSSTRPNGKTTPFGGLMSDPFETPVDRTGYMVYAGARYNFGNDERTKLGFEFNRGSQYWFNFAQAADDIISPKSNTRGNVYEIYLTHRISNRFILKTDFIKYDYNYSGSGWHLGAPKAMGSTPILGFPSYNGATMATIGLMSRF